MKFNEKIDTEQILWRNFRSIDVRVCITLLNGVIQLVYIGRRGSNGYYCIV